MSKDTSSITNQKKNLDFTLIGITNNSLNQTQPQFEATNIMDTYDHYNDKSKSINISNFYTILIFLGGYGSIVIDHKNYEIDGSLALFLAPNMVYADNKVDFKNVYALKFTEDFLHSLDSNVFLFIKQELFRNPRSPHILNLNSLNDGLFQSDMESIISECTDHPESFGDEIYKIVLFTKFIIDLQRYGECETTHNEAINDAATMQYFIFKDLVENNYHRWHSSIIYAREMGISLNSLNRYVRKVAHTRPVDIINSRIVYGIKTMLRKSFGMRINQIAYENGFADISHFNRFFKRHSGFTPTEYRNLNSLIS